MNDIAPEAAQPAAGRLAARWTRVASLGLLLAAAGSLLLVSSLLLFDVNAEGEQWFLLIFTVVPLIAALLVNGAGWWWKIAGILAGFMTSMALFWTVFGLSRAGSFFEFVPAVLVMPGALTGAVASVAAIVRRNRATAAGERPERTVIRVMLGIAATAVLLSSALTVLTKTSADPAKADFSMRMRDFEFDHVSYDLRGGSAVWVRNDDPYFHTFTVDELGVDVGIGPGSSVLIDIPARPGSYLLYCKPHADLKDPSDKGMVATLVVSP